MYTNQSRGNQMRRVGVGGLGWTSDGVGGVAEWNRGPNDTQVSVDRQGGEPNGRSSSPVLSADGRFVAFSSSASDMVPGDTNGVQEDIFVYDRQMGSTERVTMGEPSGFLLDSVDPAISADGGSWRLRLSLTTSCRRGISITHMTFSSVIGKRGARSR